MLTASLDLPVADTTNVLHYIPCGAGSRDEAGLKCENNVLFFEFFNGETAEFAHSRL